MKKFLVIFSFEFGNYIRNKAYMISTILIAVLVLGIMFVPSVFDVADLLGIPSTSEEQPADDDVSQPVEAEDKDRYVLYCVNSEITDTSLLYNFYDKNEVEWEILDNKDDLIREVEEKNAKAGFVINSLTDFEYYVFNNSMFDTELYEFENVLTTINRIYYCQKNNLDYEKITLAFNPVIKSETKILGKDMESNYWYCYALVIVIFMIIIMYGVMVATSVTQEKSNRTIEVLVTSADTNSLFFAKVLSGTLAALLQVGIIGAAALGGYKVNSEAWGGMLDMIFDIPADVIVTFAMFGLGGLLFYTFLYGAMGALVSKTEDINKSAGGLQMIIMIVYFIVLVQLTNIDGILIKVASFLPVSSYSAMFARVAMGTVSIYEITISFVILVASIIGVGFSGAKIYRMGTLRYGNPIKLSNALKLIKTEKN